jgi:hypothetical protein
VGGSAFTLTVSGTGFATTSVVQVNGAGRTTGFVSTTQLTATILAADIATVGPKSVTVSTPAPGGGTSGMATLNVNNPTPTLTSISPTTLSAGGPAFTLTVTGSGFVPASVVQWNGGNRTTTFVSATQLTASIPATDLVTVGAPQVTVFTPAPGGGTSNALAFSIINTALTVTGLTANRTAPQPPGTTITFTATATGGTAPLQYKWWVWNGTSWSVVQNWSITNTFAWTPATANANYIVDVWVRNATTTAETWDAYAYVFFPIQ